VKNFTAFIFPNQLARLPYLARVVILDALYWLLVQWKRSLPPELTDTELIQFIVGCLVLAGYLTFFVIVPRLRDTGASVWSAIFGLAPFIWPLVHLILAIQPSKREMVADRPNQSLQPTVAALTPRIPL
jgi:drug/metabolite transporter (DMT)-like permease